MSKIESMLDKIYETDPNTGHYIIEVALKNYAEIFNDWDHAPYKRKDINPELIVFLEDSIDDIPQKFDVDICFYLAAEIRNPERERVITSWFKTFFAFYIEIEKTKIKNHAKTALIYGVISAALLITSFFGHLYQNSIVVYTITEIIIVGGWVFLWEAISRLVFETKTNRRLIQNYKRFIGAPISFRYSTPVITPLKQS